MYDVVRGEAIRIDWLSTLVMDMKIRHSTTDGKPLLHISGKPTLHRMYKSAYFYPRAPWV